MKTLQPTGLVIGAILVTLLVDLQMPNYSHAQLLSQYKFDGNLLNSSTFMDTNGVTAPHGTFRIGTDSATAVAGTATFSTGVDGTPNGAISFDGNSSEGGSNGWVDVTTAGHPGAPIALVGTPTPGDDQASSGPGLVSGTVMAWVRSTTTNGARWVMGNLNANIDLGGGVIIPDQQAFLMGWSGSTLQAFPRAANSSVSRFIVSDPTNSTIWADGNWHHIAFRWNGGAEQGSGIPSLAAVFVDGVNLGAASTNYFLDPTDTQTEWQFPMSLGARNNRGTLDGFYKGLVDDLRIYSESLTDQEIFDIFDAVTVVNGSPGDFDGDGDADGRDFLIWQRGGSPSSLSPIDLNDWQTNYGSPLFAAAKAVPEPSSLFLFILGVGMLTTGRKC